MGSRKYANGKKARKYSGKNRRKSYDKRENEKINNGVRLRGDRFIRLAALLFGLSMDYVEQSK